MTCYPCSTGAPENCQHLALCGDDCCGPWDDNEEDE